MSAPSIEDIIVWSKKYDAERVKVRDLVAALRGVLDALPVQHESFALRNAVVDARKIVARAIVGSYLDGSAQ